MIDVETKDQKYQTRFNRKPIKIETSTGILTISETVDANFYPYALILGYSQQGWEDHNPDSVRVVKPGESLPDPIFFEIVYGIISLTVKEQ